MKKQIFKKTDKAKGSKVTTKENLALSTMPEYMLNVSGKNLGTIQSVNEEHIGEKSTFSGSMMSDATFEAIEEINNSEGSFFERLFNLSR